MRATADRLAEAPGYNRIESLAGMAELFVKTCRVAVTPPFGWIGDCLHECAVTIRRSIIPLLLSMSAFSIGIVVALIAGLLEAIGSIDRAGGGNITGWEREPGYWVTSMIFAGIVGSAITADLGARKIREELDAMQVLAVDPIRKLVVPRVVAMTLMAPVLGLLAVLDAMAVSYITYPFLLPNSTRAAFVNATVAFMDLPDLISLMAKLAVTGLLVGIVCCYKGMSAKGGAEGVDRAVNQAVLITFVSLWVLNSLWNVVFLANVPAVNILRG